MKMKPEHYATLEKAIKEVLPSRPTLEQYKAKGLTEMRYRWDALHYATIDGKRSTVFICDTLYKYLNDNHIDTALKAIMGTK